MTKKPNRPYATREHHPSPFLENAINSLDYAETRTTPDSIISSIVDAQKNLENALFAQVRAARRAGASWSQIGYWLGVSKQAAAKKYGNEETHPYATHLDRTDPGWGPDGMARMTEWFTGKPALTTATTESDAR